ncbi:MAG: XdhC family protein [Bacteroidetes bacterium]|nr:XdhC family protein [Bacteroidota bacterium]
MHHEFFHLAKKITQNHKNNDFALATIFNVKGSAYRREGTRMVIGTNGNWYGNISGGCLEGDILRKARKVIKTCESILVTYDTREGKNKEIRMALGCNGVIDILIEPVNDSVVKFCKTVCNYFENEETAFISTEIQLIKDKLFVSREINKTESPDFPKSTLENENYCHVEKLEFKITLYEHLGLQRKMVIWGAGPDVYPLANFSTQLGWKTIVASDCGLQNLENRLQDTEIIQSNFDDFEQKISLHQNTAVLLVSHDFYKDYFILERIIQKNVKYIGIMGPKRRGERMIQEFKKRNSEIKFDQNKIHYPVGLDIGSDNPVEIALSIVAEIQSVFSQKNAAPLKEKNTRIHDSNSNEPIEDFNPNDSVCTVNYFQ